LCSASSSLEQRHTSRNRRGVAPESLFVVADLSDEYVGRPWCQAEARAIRALRFEIDPARDEIQRLRLLNVRFDLGNVPGIFNTTAYLDGIAKKGRGMCRPYPQAAHPPA